MSTSSEYSDTDNKVDSVQISVPIVVFVQRNTGRH